MQIDPYLSLCTKFKSKWMKSLNIKSYTLKLIEEKVGNSFKYIGMGNFSKQNTNDSGSKVKFASMKENTKAYLLTMPV